MPLTDRAIKNAKPRTAPYKLADSGGLFLLVHSNGSKYWRYKYRIAKREKVLALGVYPAVSLSDARQGRDDAKRILKEGRDPTISRKLTRHEAEQNATNTFEKVTRRWIDNKRNDWTAKHADRVLDSLNKNVFPDLGNRPISEISPPELLLTLRKIEKRGALDLAQRVLQRTRSVFRYGIASGLCSHNPATDLQGALKAPKRGNRAALGAKELPDLLRKVDAYDGQPETRIALQLLVLTFVRPGELRAAEWAEFDLDASEWRIPRERMKMRAEHIVPLSKQVLALLQELKPLTGHSKYLFPGRNNPRKPMSENTLLYALYRMGYHSQATAHGFRATASTILNEQGWKPDVIERQLAHAPRNKIRAAYNRAEYLAERRQMMQAWADYLDALRKGGEIVSIRSV